TFDNTEGDAFKELSGVSLDAIVSFGRTRFRENVLFTHRGLSGPAMLQISSYWEPGKSIVLDILPDQPPDLNLLPKRLAQKLLEMYAPLKPIAQWSRKETEEFHNRLHRWTLTPNGT